MEFAILLVCILGVASDLIRWLLSDDRSYKSTLKHISQSISENEHSPTEATVQRDRERSMDWVATFFIVLIVIGLSMGIVAALNLWAARPI